MQRGTFLVFLHVIFVIGVVSEQNNHRGSSGILAQVHDLILDGSLLSQARLQSIFERIGDFQSYNDVYEALSAYQQCLQQDIPIKQTGFLTHLLKQSDRFLHGLIMHSYNVLNQLIITLEQLLIKGSMDSLLYELTERLMHLAEHDPNGNQNEIRQITERFSRFISNLDRHANQIKWKNLPVNNGHQDNNSNYLQSDVSKGTHRRNSFSDNRFPAPKQGRSSVPNQNTEFHAGIANSAGSMHPYSINKESTFMPPNPRESLVPNYNAQSVASIPISIQQSIPGTTQWTKPTNMLSGSSQFTFIPPPASFPIKSPQSHAGTPISVDSMHPTSQPSLFVMQPTNFTPVPVSGPENLLNRMASGVNQLFDGVTNNAQFLVTGEYPDKSNSGINNLKQTVNIMGQRTGAVLHNIGNDVINTDRYVVNGQPISNDDPMKHITQPIHSIANDLHNAFKVADQSTGAHSMDYQHPNNFLRHPPSHIFMDPQHLVNPLGNKPIDGHQRQDNIMQHQALNYLTGYNAHNPVPQVFTNPTPGLYPLVSNHHSFDLQNPTNQNPVFGASNANIQMPLNYPFGGNTVFQGDVYPSDVRGDSQPLPANPQLSRSAMPSNSFNSKSDGHAYPAILHQPNHFTEPSILSSTWS